MKQLKQKDKLKVDKINELSVQNNKLKIKIRKERVENDKIIENLNENVLKINEINQTLNKTKQEQIFQIKTFEERINKLLEQNITKQQNIIETNNKNKATIHEKQQQNQ